MEFKYTIILLCFVFTTFLVIKEIRRAYKARLVWRVLASIFMVTSFALLMIPITYSIKKEEPAHELSFFTEKTNHFTDLNYHLKTHLAIKKVNIYGYGLSDSELKMLKGYQISFHPSAIPSGIISASWPKKLSVSERLTVQGVYNNSTNKAVKLKLFGLGGDLDSLTIKANTKANFSFSNQPKQLGKAIFTIVALQDKDTLVAEPVPFEVLSKSPVRVLILASSPDFEYKFLKKWLYENQYPVAFRSQISKKKYSTEFLNRKAVNLNQINQALLKNIDLLISDEGELSADIFSAVNNGMGLIVRAQTTFLKSATNHQPLLRDEKGKITVDSRLSGMGKIVTTTLASTYQWQLAGKYVDYGRLWSLLFAKSLRKKVEANAFEMAPQWPRVGEKTRLTINVADTKPPVILVDGANMAPRQNMELPFLWDGFFWPKTPGWITLSINQKIENSYSYKKTDWSTVKNFDKLKATTNFAANEANTQLKAGKIEYLATEELNKWWFFALFLVTISFLWYEKTQN